jgi:putative lipoprotein
MSHNIKLFTLRLVIAALLFVVPASSFAFNEYDKIWHFSVSSAFGAASETYLHYNTKLGTPERIVYSTFLGIVPGIFKELYDDRQKDNSFDWGDMAANAGGALVGALLSNYINNRIQISFDNNGKGAKIVYGFEF